MGEVAEKPLLIRQIVQRIGVGRRVVNAMVIVQIGDRDEVLGVAQDTAQLKAGIYRVVTAAVERKLGAAELRPRLGGDIDDSCSAVPKLSRHGTGDEGDRLDQVSINFLTKAVEALGQQNPVDAILDIAVIAAHVNLPEFLLHNPRRLQEHLLKRRAFALAHRLNRSGPIL